MKDNRTRDQMICLLYLSGAKNMQQLATEFNLSRPRIQQILKQSGTTGRNEIERRQALFVSQIKDLIRREPDISKKQIAERLGLELRLLSYLITRYKISRDITLVMSRATTERRRNERAVLTYELLYLKYVAEEKSQSEIARELGYTQAAISKNIRRLGIALKKTKKTNKLKR